MKRRWTWMAWATLAAAVLVLPMVAAGQKNRILPHEINLQELERIQARIERELARVERLVEAKLSGIEKRIPSEVEEQLASLQEHKLAVLEEQLDSLREGELAEVQERVREAQRRAGALALSVSEPQAHGFFISDSESGWLGVSIDDVTAEKAKELKLPAERGVLINDVDAESPAAKAGLKKGDVITEFAGQRVEGVAQFRRYVRETPAGRSVAMTVWRDGRAQQITVTLGDMSDMIRDRVRDRIATVIPHENWGGTFNFRIPDVQVFSSMARPMLGIRTEDLDGQLGAYFGAPDSEGVLVTHVNAGSPAEKAGMKAGDVIIKVDGGRVRDTNDLRERMRDARDKKTVPVAVIRKGSETTLNVEIEQPKPAERPRITRRVAI